MRDQTFADCLIVKTRCSTVFSNCNWTLFQWATTVYEQRATFLHIAQLGQLILVNMCINSILISGVGFPEKWTLLRWKPCRPLRKNLPYFSLHAVQIVTNVSTWFHNYLRVQILYRKLLLPVSGRFMKILYRRFFCPKIRISVFFFSTVIEICRASDGSLEEINWKYVSRKTLKSGDFTLVVHLCNSFLARHIGVIKKMKNDTKIITEAWHLDKHLHELKKKE